MCLHGCSRALSRDNAASLWVLALRLPCLDVHVYYAHEKEDKSTADKGILHYCRFFFLFFFQSSTFDEQKSNCRDSNSRCTRVGWRGTRWGGPKRERVRVFTLFLFFFCLYVAVRRIEFDLKGYETGNDGGAFDTFWLEWTASFCLFVFFFSYSMCQTIEGSNFDRIKTVDAKNDE